jgi:hypothetical protein
MKLTDRRPLALRILAVLLCVAVVVFFSALLTHYHTTADADHAAHCQVCALAHITPSVAAAVDLIVLMQMLLLSRFSVPSRGSPSFVALPTTRPPPVSR